MPLNVTLLDQGTNVINASNAPPDNQVNLGLAATGTLIVDGVDVTIADIAGGGILSNTTIQAINGADVTIGSAGAGIAAGSTFHYDIGASSSITLNGGGLLSVGLLNASTINFNNTGGTGTFSFNPATIALNLSQAPTITGLSTGDQIHVIGATNATLNAGVLTFTYPGLLGIPQTLSFSLTGLPPDASITFNPTTGTVTYACFLRGTRIATPKGEVPVEKLRPGDVVLTLDHGKVAVKWVGRRLLDPKSIDRPRDALPVRIRKDALAENVPHRDLLLSPDHCLFIDDRLIPVKLLINDATIVQEVTEEPFEYFHIELDRHEVVLAEGAFTETYIDLGNRQMFTAPNVFQLMPDSMPAPQPFCYPPAYDGPVVEASRQALAERARLLGHAPGLAMAS